MIGPPSTETQLNCDSIRVLLEQQPQLIHSFDITREEWEALWNRNVYTMGKIHITLSATHLEYTYAGTGVKVQIDTALSRLSRRGSAWLVNQLAHSMARKSA